jgi:hypothetical protein
MNASRNFRRFFVIEYNLIDLSFAITVAENVPAFWLTINPADLRNPLVLKLAGIDISCDDLSTQARRIRQSTANMNPVAVAQFFHQICGGVFEALLTVGKNKPGILGEISNYFGVVETNGRGMLHLHSLIWLAGNLEFFTLRDRLQTNPIFATDMKRYMNSTDVGRHLHPIPEYHSGLCTKLTPPLTASWLFMKRKRID